MQSRHTQPETQPFRTHPRRWLGPHEVDGRESHQRDERYQRRQTDTETRFGHLIEAVKPLGTAKAVRIDCGDKWYEHLSLEDVLHPRVLLTLDMEGKPLSDSHGAPLRLIDPRKYGYKSAKMIVSITFVEKMGGSMACDLGPYYSADGDIQPGYDHPLDLGDGVRHKIRGGEIEY